MRKTHLLALALAAVLAVTLAGCEKKDGGAQSSPSPSESAQQSPQSTSGETDKPPEILTELEGSAEAVLESVLAAAEQKLAHGDGLPMSFTEEIKAENATGLGLTVDEYEKHVGEGSISTALMSTLAHEVAVLKCKDAESAGEVKKLIAEGFDTGKWVSVQPERCAVVDASEFVLLAASNKDACDALTGAFRELADDKTGGVNEFFTKEQ